MKHIIFILTLLFFNILFSQPSAEFKKYPVVIDLDTLFYISSGIGVFSAEKRAEEISSKLNNLIENDSLIYDSIRIVKQMDYVLLKLHTESIMAITKTDARLADTTDVELAKMYRRIILQRLNETREIYNQKSLTENGLYTLLYLALLIVFFWTSTKVFPWIYRTIELKYSKKIKSLRLKRRVIISSSAIVKIVLMIFKGVRFALVLLAIYLFVTKALHLWPYTRKWDLQPLIESMVLFIFYSVVFIAIIKSIRSLRGFLTAKYESWKGTRIKSIKIKSFEVLSADRTVNFLTLITKAIRFFLFIIVLYIYITITFSLFTFSETWATTLIGYILTPLNSVFMFFLRFLPNLFFIIVLIFVFNYIIKVIKFLFLEIDKGNLVLPGFYKDWSVPTYKIVRFIILVLGAIVIFPYLPGSDSPVFQGISVFLGILFSFGSTSAISNMVAGVVLTYMRPFKLGDRVKIADTMGDVTEKTLLVTRIRTIKNVDITVPNAMVLGSHIINYSSSAANKGLILNTTVTIGYDAPWKQIHSLLINAAQETEYILKEPKPFVLQTSLDDFYVSYEINAYTNESLKMAEIYSALHSKIQDKFNEAGIEIMSPHYSSMRDGNRTTVPQEYLPKEYKASAFRIFGVNLFGNQTKGDS